MTGAGPHAWTSRAVRIVLAPGAAASVGEELERMGARRPWVVSTPGRATLVQSVIASFGSVAGVFTGARLHVPLTVADDATAQASRSGADAIVAVGGGSAIGVAKAVALRTALPILAVPTTYSGSEMTSIWGMTSGEEKRTGRDERAAPRVVVYDPLLTLELDSVTSAASGLNAIAHCVEALYAPDANALASLLAEEGIRAMAAALRRIVVDGRDVEARAQALHAAHMAGRALDMTTMGLHHRLCHVLGGTFGLPHALTHAILLPHVVAWIAPAAPAAMMAIANALAHDDAVTPVDFPDALEERDAAAALQALRHTIGIRSTLADLGFAERAIDHAATRVVGSAIHHPRPVTPVDVKQILRAALGGTVDRQT
ncbi:MAG: maleylacetate reductase [Gemmatimonadetes bacterium]|nr:maleylacetate reductase [Gemmatimonadota bacterium]